MHERPTTESESVPSDWPSELEPPSDAPSDLQAARPRAAASAVPPTNARRVIP